MPGMDRHGWNVLGFTLLFQGASFGILIYSFALFVVPWLETFGASRGQTMMAVAGLQLGIGWASPFVGRALDAFSARWIVISGALLIAVGLWMLARTTALWQVILIYATLLPVGLAMTGPLAAQTLVARWFVRRRGMAVGISAIGTSLGGFMIPVVTGLLITTIGWRATLDWLSLGLLLAIVPGAFWILKRPPPERAVVSPAAGDGTADPEREWPLSEILRAPAFRVTILAMLPINIAFGGVQFNIGAYAQDLGFGPERAALVISAIALAMIGGKFCFGALADRVDHRLLHSAAALGMLLGLLLVVGQPGYGRLLMAAACIGAAAGGILPLISVIVASRFAASAFGRVMGMMTLFITLAAFGSLLAGALRDLLGSYDGVFLGFAILLLPTLVVIRRLPPASVAW